MPAPDRFEAAMAAIDEANAEDPNLLEVGGQQVAKELVHAEVVERWVRQLDPGASQLQLLAARAHHLRRWVVPRADYPEGRAGYLRWRRDHKARQAEEVTELLLGCGWSAEEAADVADLVAKRHLGTDPRAQVHEDALCLAFLELQFAEVAASLGDDRTIDVLRKTIPKMSATGLAAAGTLELDGHLADLLARAVEAAAARVDRTDRAGPAGPLR